MENCGSKTNTKLDANIHIKSPPVYVDVNISETLWENMAFPLCEVTYKLFSLHFFICPRVNCMIYFFPCFAVNIFTR